jgi:AAA15 family ATPase/GTPase
MISMVSVQNFKNLRELKVDLEPVTVLVGANGSGKTSLLDAIELASLASIKPQKAYSSTTDTATGYTRAMARVTYRSNAMLTTELSR